MPYLHVKNLARRYVKYHQFGLTPGEQVFLLRMLTHTTWEVYQAPKNERLRALRLRAVYDGSSSDNDYLRVIFSTYKFVANKTFRHSLFSDGNRIYDPWVSKWFTFSQIRQLPRFRTVFVNDMIVKEGSFVQP